MFDFGLDSIKNAIWGGGGGEDKADAPKPPGLLDRASAAIADAIHRKDDELAGVATTLATIDETNPDMMEVMRGRSPEEIAEIKRRYEAEHPGESFDERFGGRIQQMGWEDKAVELAHKGFGSWDAIDSEFKGKSRGEIIGMRDEYEKYRAAHPEETLPGWDERFGTDVGRWEKSDVDPEKTTEAVTAMLNADGLATVDQDGILDAIRGKSLAELAAMRAEFKERTGEDLDAWVEARMTGWTGAGSDSDLAEAQASLHGDQATAAFMAIQNATIGGYTGAGTDEDKVWKVLEGLSEDDRKRLLKEHPEVRALLESETSFTTEEKTTALLDGDKATARDIDLEWAAGAQDAAAMQAALDKCTTDGERQALVDAHKKRMDASFWGGPSDLNAYMDCMMSDTELAVASATMTQAKDLEGGEAERDAKIRVAKIGVAQDHILSTDKEALYDTLELTEEERQLPPAERAKKHAERMKYMQEAWDADPAHAGTKLEDMLAKETASVFDCLGAENLEHQRALQLVTKGDLDTAFAIHYATKGIGTNEEMIDDATKGKTTEEMAQAAKDHETLYGESMEETLKGELDGRELHDALSDVKYGDKATSIEAMAAKEGYDYDFEQGAGAGTLSFLTRGLSKKDDYMKAAHDRIQELGKKAKDGGLTAEEREELERRMRGQQGNIAGWRADSNSITDGAISAIEIAAAIAATVLTEGGAAPWVAELLGSMGTTAITAEGTLSAAALGFNGATAALFSGVGGHFAKQGFLGDAYGQEEQDVAALMMFGKMGLAFAAPGITKSMEGGVEGLTGSKAMGTIIGGAAGGTINGAAGSALGVMGNDDLWDGKLSASDVAGTIGLDAFKGGVGNAAQGALGMGTEDFAKKHPWLAGGAIGKMVGGAVPAVVGEVAGAAVQGKDMGTADFWGEMAAVAGKTGAMGLVEVLSEKMAQPHLDEYLARQKKIDGLSASAGPSLSDLAAKQSDAPDHFTSPEEMAMFLVPDAELKSADLGLSAPEALLREKGMTAEEILQLRDTYGRDAQVSKDFRTRPTDEVTSKQNFDGSDRKPLTDEQKQLILRAQTMLYDDVETGMDARKVVPDADVGKILAGKWHGLTGDFADEMNSKDQGSGQTTKKVGLDYDKSPFTKTEIDPQTGKPVVKLADSVTQNGIYSVDFEMTPELTAAAKVPFATDMFAYAKQVAKWFEAEGITPPAFLALDDKDELANVTPRTRSDQKNPSTGIGATAPQGLSGGKRDKDVTFNQELTLAKKADKSGYSVPDGAKLTRTDAKGKQHPVATYDAATKAWMLAPGISAEDKAFAEQQIAAQSAGGN